MKIGEVKSILIDQEYPDFTCAISIAHRQAQYIVGLDEDGHFTCVDNSERSTDSLHIKFHSLEFVGSSWVFRFDVWVSRSEDD